MVGLDKRSNGRSMTTAEEWTSETVAQLWIKNGALVNIADAHNAAIAQLREQLAKTERMLDLAGAQNWGIDNLAKLDDLRERSRSVQDWYSRKLTEENTRSVAAERQLDAAKAEDTRLADQNVILHDKLDAAVEALKDMRGYDADRVDAALAKITASAGQVREGK
jgi:hypothetical protein